MLCAKAYFDVRADGLNSAQGTHESSSRDFALRVKPREVDAYVTRAEQ